MRKAIIPVCMIFVISSILPIGQAVACTDFQIEAIDGSIVIGRAMDFHLETNSAITVYQRGERLSSSSPGGKKGYEWTSKYGFVGVNAFGNKRYVLDGLNEAGLSAGFLWLQEAGYQTVKDSEATQALIIYDVSSWLLGSFASTAEVKEGIKGVRVWGEVVPEINMVPPFHVAVHDTLGNNLVIEFIDGQVKLYDNPIGVLTNSPPFDWHIMNLRSYINLTNLEIKPMDIAGVTIKSTGYGSGLIGIPGSWASPSRFVRTVLFTHFANPTKDALGGVTLAVHILNTIDTPRGPIKEKEGESFVDNYTQWASIKDLINKVFYFRDYRNMGLRAIDLKKIDFKSQAKVKLLPIASEDYGVVDVTERLF